MALPDEARGRSVDNLQTLYAFVVGLAVTEALRRQLVAPATSALVVDRSAIFVLVSLVITVIPFFHGANRYLDATYVICERQPTRSWALLADFVLLFLQGIWFYVLALLSGNVDAFYTGLAALLVFDIVWVGATHLYGTSPPSAEGYIRWAAVNAVTVLILFTLVWADVVAFRAEWAREVLLMGIVIARTILDYIVSWSFYYPAVSPPSASNATAD